MARGRGVACDRRAVDGSDHDSQDLRAQARKRRFKTHASQKGFLKARKSGGPPGLAANSAHSGVKGLGFRGLAALGALGSLGGLGCLGFRGPKV